MKRLLQIIFLLMLVSCASEEDSDVSIDPIITPTVTLFSQAGSVVVSVELAETPAEQELGLKFRESLDPFAGMLFIFNSEAVRLFTMEDTFIPLDIIFIDSSFQIVGIERNTIPNTPGPYSTNIPFTYALEVNAGFSERFSINPGDMVAFNGFDF